MRQFIFPLLTIALLIMLVGLVAIDVLQRRQPTIEFIEGGGIAREQYVDSLLKRIDSLENGQAN